jgi:hypothetical protein
MVMVMSVTVDQDEDEEQERRAPFEISGSVPFHQEGATAGEDVEAEEAEREERVVVVPVALLTVTKTVISTGVDMGSDPIISVVGDGELDSYSHDREPETQTEREGLLKEEIWKVCRLE